MKLERSPSRSNRKYDVLQDVSLVLEKTLGSLDEITLPQPGKITGNVLTSKTYTVLQAKWNEILKEVLSFNAETDVEHWGKRAVDFLNATLFVVRRMEAASLEEVKADPQSFFLEKLNIEFDGNLLSSKEALGYVQTLLKQKVAVPVRESLEALRVEFLKMKEEVASCVATIKENLPRVGEQRLQILTAEIEKLQFGKQFELVSSCGFVELHALQNEHEICAELSKKYKCSDGLRDSKTTAHEHTPKSNKKNPSSTSSLKTALNRLVVKIEPKLKYYCSIGSTLGVCALFGAGHGWTAAAITALATAILKFAKSNPEERIFSLERNKIANFGMATSVLSGWTASLFLIGKFIYFNDTFGGFFLASGIAATVTTFFASQATFKALNILTTKVDGIIKVIAPNYHQGLTLRRGEAFKQMALEDEKLLLKAEKLALEAKERAKIAAALEVQKQAEKAAIIKKEEQERQALAKAAAIKKANELAYEKLEDFYKRGKRELAQGEIELMLGCRDLAQSRNVSAFNIALSGMIFWAETQGQYTLRLEQLAEEAVKCAASQGEHELTYKLKCLQKARYDALLGRECDRCNVDAEFEKNYPQAQWVYKTLYFDFFNAKAKFNEKMKLNEQGQG